MRKEVSAMRSRKRQISIQKLIVGIVDTRSSIAEAYSESV